MSTKKPSSLKDSTQISSYADLFFRDGAFLHHAFCVEGSNNPRALFIELQKQDAAPHFLTPYIKVVDTFTIDMAREILDIAKKSYSNNAHQLIFISALIYTREAQNGLLKVLEEPQPSTTFFIFSRQANQLLDTIRSRVQTVTLGDTAASKIGEHADAILRATPPERIAYCDSLMTSFEKEEISRTDIAAIIEEIEKALHNKVNHGALKYVAQLRTLLGLPSASTKQVLEGVATILNLFD